MPKNITFVNKAAFDALDKPTQDAVLKAAATAEERGWKSWEEKTKWYHDEIAKKGMKVAPPGAELCRRLQEDRRAAHRRLAEEGRRRTAKRWSRLTRRCKRLDLIFSRMRVAPHPGYFCGRERDR